MYTAQGELQCNEHFVRSGTRDPLYETFEGGVNTRPNEATVAPTDAIISNDILKQAILNGCSVTVEKNKGYNINNCNKPQAS